MPPADYIWALAELAGVTTDWILTGEEPKHRLHARGRDPVAAALDAATMRIAEVVAAIRQEAGLPAISPGAAAAAGAERMLQDLRDADQLPGDEERPGGEGRRRTPA